MLYIVNICKQTRMRKTSKKYSNYHTTITILNSEKHMHLNKFFIVY